MNARKLQLSFAFTLGLLALVGMLTLLGTWGSGPALAQAGTGTIRVATTGNDAPGCGGTGNPCRTVQYAVDQAANDEEIWVATGIYTGVQARAGITQVVCISKTLTLRGGYSADFNEWDPETYLTTLDAQGSGRVLYITGDISPTVEGFRITGGDATGLGGGWWGGDGGGGVYVITAAATISRNTIINNVASSSDWDDGSGGGVYLHHSDARVINNIIAGNQAATNSWVDGWGGGLCAEGGAPTLRHNQILDNQAGVGGFFGGGSGGGLYLVESQPILEANQIRQNRAVGSGDWGSGGGVEIAACPDFLFINNVIADNVAPFGGSGIWIGHISGVPSQGRLLHTTIARNQGGAGMAGVRVAGGSIVTMTNTILSGHDTGINVSFGSTATLTATLWNNATDWGGVGAIFTGTINIWGDPSFLDPDGGDYHIAFSSPARDQGVDAGVSTDIDGEPRDANPDLGADEVGGWGLQVVKAASATDLYPGDAVTYTIAVASAGTSGVTNVVLTDTLPTLQRPLAVSYDRGTCSIADAGYGGVVVCIIGDLDVGQAGRITITAQVTTTVPLTLPQTMRNIAYALGDQAQGTAYADTVLHAPLDCHARVNGTLPEYTTVQAAVDAAEAGDEVWIAGTCVGAFGRGGLFQQVALDKSLTLRGGYSTDFSAWDPDVHVTTLDANGQGRVVYVEGPIAVTLEALHLTGGDATGLGGASIGFADAGGGLFAVGATVTLSRVHVTGNVASTSFDGFGGGVYVTTATLTLVEATLSGNAASLAVLGLGYGGGLAGEFSTVRLEGSRLEENVAAGTLPGSGGGAYLYESDLEARATLWLSNIVSADFDWGQGGGLYLAGSRPFTLTNCVVADNRAYDATGESGSGLWIDGAPGVLLHPTIARNRGGEGIMATYTATVAITNAIVVSHSIGIKAMEGSTVIVNGVLWHDNVSDTIAITATVQVGNVITGSPAFAPDGYHITPASQARDNGIVSPVVDDLDGDPRPAYAGYDLGADELFPHLSVTKRGTPDPVEAGAALTYTIRLTNTGYITFTALVTDILPAHVAPGGVLTWTAEVLAPDGVWTQTVAVTVDVGYSGILTNVVLATTEEGATGVYVATTTAFCIGLDEVGIAGPPTTTAGIPVTFIATISPPDAVQPITYTWRVSESASQRVSEAARRRGGEGARRRGNEAAGRRIGASAGWVITHTGGLSDTLVFTWNVAGPQVVTVTAVNECGIVVSDTHSITVTNEPPVADAGPDQSVIVGAEVMLDGSGSYDPDGHLPLTYGWAQIGGPTVGGPWSTAIVTFTAPDIPTVLTFTLVVTDAYGLADPTPDTVAITVEGGERYIYVPLVLRNVAPWRGEHIPGRGRSP